MSFDNAFQALVHDAFTEKKGYSNNKVPSYIFKIPKLHRRLINRLANQFLIIKGGRGGFKTTSFISALIEFSYHKKYKNTVTIFTREIAKSISDSVYSNVIDLIEQADKTDDFIIQKTNIVNKKTGVKFLFMGLRSTSGKTAMSQLNKVKSLYNVSFFFLEEGQDLSEDSLNVLIPTATRKGTVLLHNKKQKKSKIPEARFFVAMNPNKKIDPVIAKFKPYIDAGKGVIAHLNMLDIVNDEPKFRDEQLINQMNLEKNEYYFEHVWNGAPFHRFAGLAFSKHAISNLDGDFNVVLAFIDPSFKGGAYSAIAFLAERDGKIYGFGYGFKQAWNMSPTFDEFVKLIKRYGPDRIYYEDNGLGTVPQTTFASAKIKLFSHTSILNKDDRIYKVAAFTQNLVTLAPNLSNSVFIEHVAQYADDAEYKDCPDAFANAIIKSGVIREKIKF